MTNVGLRNTIMNTCMGIGSTVGLCFLGDESFLCAVITWGILP
jgi:hypothetical protein